MIVFEMLQGLSLEDAIKEYEQALADARGGKCMWVNYIGTLAAKGDHEAEAFLQRIITESDNEVCVKTAYSYLTDAIQDLLPETSDAIATFQQDPRNSRLISEIEEYMKRRKGVQN